MSSKKGETPFSIPSKKEIPKLRAEFGKTKVCPKCNKRKDILTKFGYRPDRDLDRKIPQSYCKECR